MTRRQQKDSPDARVKERVAELREILGRDWALPASSIKREKVHGFLEEKLFADLPLQQFLYDTEELQALLKSLWASLALFGDDSPFPAPSRIVLYKLLAHESYGGRDDMSWNVAIQLMLKADSIAKKEILEQARTDVKPAIWQWYRLFLLDHASNRMKRDDPRRGDYTTIIDGLLPAILGQSPNNSRIGRAEWPFLLRAAHYWGHRGNVILSELQSVHFADTTKSTADLEALARSIGDGISHYHRAIAFRIAAFEISFPGETICARQAYEALVRAWAPFECEPATSFSPLPAGIETFETKEQGIGDLGNQFSALTCLFCHRYAFLSRFDSSSKLSQAGEDIRHTCELADALWDAANREIQKHRGRYLRTFTWKRVSEHMLALMNLPETKRWARDPHYYEDPLENRKKLIIENFAERQLSTHSYGSNS